MTLLTLHQADDLDDRAPVAGRERLLLGLGGAFLLVNHLALLLAGDRSALHLWPVAVWALCAAGGHILLSRRLPARDPLLFPLAMLLTGWGLNLIARLVPSYAVRQTSWLVVGVVVLLVLTALPRDLRWLRRYRYTWLIGGLALLFLTILVGQNPADAGPRLWLWLGFGRVYYQPSELLKILLVAFLASYFAEHGRYMRQDTVRLGPWRVPSPAFLGPVLLMWSVCVIVLVWQRDLGTATLFFAVFMAMLYLASGQALLLAGGAALLILASAAAYHLFTVVALRIDIWWNPWPMANAGAYQLVQSLIAVASGGVLGQGIGQGYPGIVPVVHSDFAFAAIAEEWGLVGTLGVIGALAALVVRGMRVAAQARQPFHMLLAAGLSTLLAVQSLLIMGGVLKLVPLTGVTLPFISYGGSSLLTSFAAVGLLLILSEGGEHAP
jgi:cell division protein FtsW